MRAPYGARSQPVSVTAATNGSRLIGGPIRVCGWSFNNTTPAQGLTVDQSAAAPAAGGQVAAISLPNGQYVVSWTFELTGTPGAGDVDNVKVTLGAAQLTTSVNLGVVGNYAQEEFAVTVTGGPVSLVWKAIGVATAGTTYKVEANIQPVGNTLGQIQDGGMSVGFVEMAQGSVCTVWLDQLGIRVETELSVLATVGSFSGVIWYYLVFPDKDYADVGDPDDKPHEY